jgi:hypothetical protein
MIDARVGLMVDDAKALAAMAKRQLGIDARMPVRIVSRPNALGLYTALPMDVIAFVAIPATFASGEEVDLTVSLASLSIELDRVVASQVPLDLSALPEVRVPVTKKATIALLPPSDGWQLPMFAVAGDLVPQVDASVEEFTRRSKGLSERAQQEIAEEIWERPAWAGLSMRMLHAARRLGLLAQDRSRIAAATCGPWRRLSTPRGQVFARASGRLDLNQLR